MLKMTSDNVLEGVIPPSDCEKNFNVKWLSGTPTGSFYIGDNESEKKGISNFIKGKHKCKINSNSYFQYLSDLKEIVFKFKNMFYGPTNVLETNESYFKNLEDIDRHIVISYDYPDRYLKTSKFDENVREFKLTLAPNITHIKIERKNNGDYEIFTNVINNWREEIMKKSAKCNIEKVKEIYKDFESNNIRRNSLDTARLFGIKYEPLLRNNGVNANMFFDTGTAELAALENGMKLSRDIIWESKSNELKECDEQNYEDSINAAWYVGATGHDEDGVYTDFSDKYIQEGIWINGYNNKYIDKVKNVCAGDRIALKASFTKKNGLPFDTNGKTVGVMGIKAIGTVVENIGDGKNLKVEWVKLDNVKYWYGAGVLRNTIHYIDGTVSLIKQALLDFTFGNGTQDYELCEQQYLDEEEVSAPETFKCNEQYDKNMFLNEVFMSEADYDTLKELVEYKKNIILQGAPGVGKTFLAKRFAYSLMGEKDDDRVGFVQFHQNYSYEDFIQGYRPNEDGFKLVDGVFYKFCKKAEKSDKPHYFIIDEINRGNLSKIFGELMMLVESDKRGDSATLVYSGCKFSVPKNVYVIGMMNTADRSLAIMDYALRRRFSFFEIEPAFSNSKFKTHLTLNGIDNQTMDKIIQKFSELNGYIANEKESGLGKGFQIGHSYFCGKPNCNVDKWYGNIMKYEISPILYEYWFDEEDKAKEWLGKLV